MYISIAICDDEIAVCNQVEQYITEFLNGKEIDFHIDIFTSGTSLCDAMRSESYDLVFQDIELPDINGIQTGSYIRNVLLDNTVQIVYISSIQSYAMELFESRPMNFLVKPLTFEKVQNVLKTFLHLFGETEAFFTFKVSGHFHKLPLSDILYFESNRRKVTVVTKDASYEFYDSLKNIEKRISSHYFMMIHQSLLVNFNHITYFEYDRITMSNGDILPVSQSRRSDVRNNYVKLLEGGHHD